jgi:hypothetical protein
MTFKVVIERRFIMKLFYVRAVKPVVAQGSAFVFLAGTLFRIRRLVLKYLILFS